MAEYTEVRMSLREEGATVGGESIGGLCTVASAPTSPPLDLSTSLPKDVGRERWNALLLSL